jgi:hypothetical protein
MKRIILVLALCALGVALTACNGVNPNVDPTLCPNLRAGVDAACAAGASQTCTAATLAYSAAGCGVYVPPTPTPPKNCSELKCPPTGAPEKTACAETPEGPACYAPPISVCPEACPEGFECKDPKIGCVAKPPVPSVCPTCPTGYHCTDPAVGCVKDPVVPPVGEYLDDTKLTAKEGDNGKQTWQITWNALTAVKAAHPEVFTPDQSGVEKDDIPGNIGKVYGFMRVELAKIGVDGGQSKGAGPGGQVSDCIFVQRKGSNEYEEVHLFEYGGGKHGTSSSAIKGVYIYTGVSPVPGPTPPGPVVDKCPFEPCPAREWTAETLPPGWGEDQIGKPAYQFNSKPHTMQNCDSTPLIVRQCGFCNEVMNDPARCSCPVRPDGHPQRVAVENWLLYGGPVRISRNGADCTPNNTDNPFAYLNSPDCKLCNTTGTVCTTGCGWIQ